jgi:hypothetical protein
VTRNDLSWRKLYQTIVLTSAPVFVTSACILFISLDRLRVTTNGALGIPEAGAATAVASKAERKSICVANIMTATLTGNC